MKYVIDHDFHLHTCLSSCSNDPHQTADALAAYARENGLSHLCVTDHFWDSAVEGASAWYKPQDLAHISEILPLPVSNDVKISFGCEIDMDKHLHVGISEAIFDRFDFIVAPTNHLHMTGFTVESDDNSVSRRAELFMKRNHALLDMQLPFHKMGLAHFTDICLAYYSDGTRDDVLSLISDAELYELFERVAARGMGVELNVPLDDCSNEVALRPYRIAARCGCKFYLGSDAHTRRQLGTSIQRFQAIVDALELCEDDKFRFA